MRTWSIRSDDTIDRQPERQRHDPDSRRHVPHGLGQALSRGGAGPSRHRRRVLDRPDAGHQPPVPRLRPRHRACHRRGNRARPEGLSRRPAAPALCGLARVQPAGLSGRSPSLQPMVGVQAQGELAPSLRPGLVDQGPGRASGRACRLCRCGGLCPLGRQGPADRGRMGVRRPRRAGPGGVRLGRRVHAGRTPDGQHLAGRLSIPEHASRRLRAHLARSPPSRRTATASTT